MPSLKNIRHLSIEIGPRCNLAKEHILCPAHIFKRDGQPMSIETITNTIKWALKNGFDGWVGFHYYCEPMLYIDRMQIVMEAVPSARYCLWTNGYKQEHPIVKKFDKVFLSNYSNKNYNFDQRIENYESQEPYKGECWRPFLEIPIDYEGRVHLCCQDWRGDCVLPNVCQGPEDAITKWLDYADRCSKGNTPKVCANCRGPMSYFVYCRACIDSKQTPRTRIQYL